jgi:hypothetical protein
LILNAGSTFRVELNGTSAGSQHDQANVAGGVTLNDGILDVSLGYIPAEGDSFTIINNDDADDVMGLGTFKVDAMYGEAAGVKFRNLFCSRTFSKELNHVRDPPSAF